MPDGADSMSPAEKKNVLLLCLQSGGQAGL